jgi:hypothetical protein
MTGNRSRLPFVTPLSNYTPLEAQNSADLVKGKSGVSEVDKSTNETRAVSLLDMQQKITKNLKNLKELFDEEEKQ